MAQKFSFRPGMGTMRSAGTCWASQNRDVEFVFWNCEPFGGGDQLPGVGDGFYLEVVAEGKIAEHLEEGVVALGEADIFQVVVFAAGADAFLRGGGFVVFAFFEAEEDVFKLVHAGVGEEQGGIAVRDERGAAHAAMAFALEEAKEGFANFVAGPEFWLWLRDAHDVLK